MYDAITRGLALNARLDMEKAYSRDWLTRGRVHVELKRNDGVPCNADIPSKLILLVRCAELCARHADRPKRLEHYDRYEQQLFSGGAAQPKTKSVVASSKVGTANTKQAKPGTKKKGKKK
jgi:hypothetical protein